MLIKCDRQIKQLLDFNRSASYKSDESISVQYLICDSRGRNFDIICIHILWSSARSSIKVYIFLKEMTQGILLLQQIAAVI